MENLNLSPKNIFRFAGCGSDVAGLSSKATAGPSNTVVLNGAKNWITNGGEAKATVVFVKAINAEKRHHVSSYLVNLPSKGVSVGKKEDKLGIRASSTCPITFEDCAIPENRLLGTSKIENSFLTSILLLKKINLPYLICITQIAITKYSHAFG